MGISYLIETTLPSTDYELLDSGDGEKLERYGDVIVARPDPQALWPKSLSKEECLFICDLLSKKPML
jgi:23S rRNA (cytosine1962-C5)-methyltransferase